MKILFISEYYPPHVKGGAEISTSLLAEWLSLKHSVTVACAQFPEKNWVQNGISVHSVIYKISLEKKTIISSIVYGIGIIIMPLVSAIRTIILIIKIKPDIVNIVPSSYQYIPTILVVRLLFRLPTVVDCRDGSLICPTFFGKNGLEDTKHSTHGYRCLKEYEINNKFLKIFILPFALYESIIFNFYKKSFRLVLNNFNKIEMVAVSEFMRQQLILNGFQASKIRTIHNIGKIFNKSESSVLPADNIPTFSYAGRIDREKGVWDLVTAAELLKKENHTFILNIAGVGPDFVKLQKYVQDKNFNYINLLGYINQEQVLNLYSNSSVIMGPSKAAEAFARFIPEAISVGKPIIATRNGGIPEGIDDKVTGLLVDVGDVVQLSKAMKFFIENPEQILKMNKDIVEKQKNYKADFIGAKRLKVYQSLLF